MSPDRFGFSDGRLCGLEFIVLEHSFYAPFVPNQAGTCWWAGVTAARSLLCEHTVQSGQVHSRRRREAAKLAITSSPTLRGGLAPKRTADELRAAVARRLWRDKGRCHHLRFLSKHRGAIRS